ncbi:MAG: cation:proton antiporter [Gammaproteobacteria bacterium]|nr:cation:proton antiporter [Gammaproteobacteria bacterium]
MVEPSSLLLNFFIYLFVALLAVPTATRLGLGPVLGYLLAGIVIGPWGLAMIREPEHIHFFERFGTILLLLLVGLRVTPARVRLLLNDFFSLAFWQCVLTTLAVMFVAMLIGLPWHHALVSGLAMSLSSGAIAHHWFRERYPAGSTLTESGNRILLTQSLTILPILMVIPLLGFDSYATRGSAWPMVVELVIAVVAIAVVGQWLLKTVFRYIVSLGLDDVFAAFALLLVIGILLIMQVFRLPLEVGAFLAALLLIRSEYGSAISIAIRPFQGLLVGLFFISVGMSIDFGMFIRKPTETVALVVLLVVVKAWIIRTLLRFSSVPRRQRVWLATVLSQSGELAFVVIQFAHTYNAIPSKLDAQLMLVVLLSMLTTPLLLHFAARRDGIPAKQQTNTGLSQGERANSQVIIAGYGRVGQVIADLLSREGYRTAIIEHSPVRFGELRTRDLVGFYGDALRPDLLEAAGADQAVVMVVAIDDSERSEELIRRVRRDYPHMTVIARASDAAAVAGQMASGVDRSYRETFETALLMGEDALELVGASPLEAQAFVERYRDEQSS